VTGLRFRGNLRTAAKKLENRRSSGVPGPDGEYGAMLNPGESWTAPAQHINGLSPATLQGQLLLSGKPPLNLARYIRELQAYPYG
jgi:uncharacterized protein YfaS (alpha-2-macroglobulin family)